MQIDDQTKETFKRTLVSAVAENPNTTREHIIGMVCGFLDRCLGELLEGGSLTLEPASSGESHLDVFLASPTS